LASGAIDRQHLCGPRPASISSINVSCRRPRLAGQPMVQQVGEPDRLGG
jgi:hypothetical protein